MHPASFETPATPLVGIGIPPVRTLIDAGTPDAIDPPALRACSQLARRVDPLPLRPSRPERVAIIVASALAGWMLFGLIAALIMGRL